MSAKHYALTGVLGAVTLVLPIPGLAVSKGSNPHVKGSLRPFSCSSFCIGHDDVAEGVQGSNVWCAWKGDHVQVHITLINTSDDDVTASIRTTYRIVGHGRHGSSLRALRRVTIDGNSRRDWFGDAGKPDDVPTGTAISTCEPSVSSVSRHY